MSLFRFSSLNDIARQLRNELESKKYILLYAHNGTGKTRLSMAFKDLGRDNDARDTLYFNAFTEDLFTWDNDLEDDNMRVLRLNSSSKYISGIAQLEMESRIRLFLHRYVDIDFAIDYENWSVIFSREIIVDGRVEKLDNIKVSRGEENIFIWCFFLAVVRLVIDGDETYVWVKYIYIDDPISSLDEHNAIAVANHLAQLLKEQDRVKIVISSHHALFFNVLCNELKNATKYFLGKPKSSEGYTLHETGDTPFFHHVAVLAELYQAERSGRLYTYHFNMLRSILEKTASFHGFKHFSACIELSDDDPDKTLRARFVNILSHGNYSLFEPVEMMEENKTHFKEILNNFLTRYPFNSELFSVITEESTIS